MRVFFFKVFYLFIVREKKGGRKRGRETWMCERYIDWLLPTRELAHNPGMCPDQESNWWSFGLQAGTQSTESRQPGLNWSFNKPPNPRKHVLASAGGWDASVFEIAHWVYRAGSVRRRFWSSASWPGLFLPLLHCPLQKWALHWDGGRIRAVLSKQVRGGRTRRDSLRAECLSTWHLQGCTVFFRLINLWHWWRFPELDASGQRVFGEKPNPHSRCWVEGEREKPKELGGKIEELKEVRRSPDVKVSKSQDGVSHLCSNRSQPAHSRESRPFLSPHRKINSTGSKTYM